MFLARKTQYDEAAVLISICGFSASPKGFLGNVAS